MHERIDHVRLAVADAVPRGTEEIPARRISEKVWEITRSPLYATELAAGDVVRVVDDATGEFEIVSRGGNVCVQFYLAASEADDAVATKREVAALREQLQPLGGRIDGYTPGLIALTLSAGIGFSVIEELLSIAVARRKGAQWQYSNVYDPTTGEPLGWWE